MQPSEINDLFRSILSDDRLPKVVDFLKHSRPHLFDAFPWIKAGGDGRLTGEVENFLNERGLTALL